MSDIIELLERPFSKGVYHLSSFVLVFFLSFLSFEVCQGRESCIVPSTLQLKSFFEGYNLWTEVKSASSRTIASKDVIRLEINFLNPEESKITKGSKNMGNLSRFCTNEMGSKFFISTTMTNIELSKTRYGSLVSELHFLGFSFRYYYLPDNQVLR